MLKSINKKLSLITKLNSTFTILILFLNFLFDVNDWRIIVTSLLILTAILAFDYYMIVSTAYPTTWIITKWILLLSILIISLVGLFAKISLVFQDSNISDSNKSTPRKPEKRLSKSMIRNSQLTEPDHFFKAHSILFLPMKFSMFFNNCCWNKKFKSNLFVPTFY